MAKRRTWRDDDGAAIVMVAASMLVIMGMAALVIDLGNGWRTRRALIPATDAAALAAAQAYVDGETGCDIAPDYLTYNEAAATLVSCNKVDIDDDRGRVTVTASHNVETWFASVIGLGDYTVGSVSTAAWAPPGSVYGLRPIGLCIESPTDHGTWDTLRKIVEADQTPEVQVTIPYSKDDQPADCGDSTNVPGNWGPVDFTGEGNQFKEWIENGYNGPVSYHMEDVDACDEHCVGGDPGDLSGGQNELDDLRASGQPFTLPVFNYVNDLTGNNFQVHIAAILQVRLVDYKLTGNPDTREFTLEIDPGLVTGGCCDGGSGSGSGGNKVIAICGVDPGEFEACGP